MIRGLMPQTSLLKEHCSDALEIHRKISNVTALTEVQNC